MAAVRKMKETPPQLLDEKDRDCLREYLTKRLVSLKRARKRQHSGEGYDEGFYEGSEMEVIFAFDELLGEQPPDTRRKPRSG